MLLLFFSRIQNWFLSCRYWYRCWRISAVSIVLRRYVALPRSHIMNHARKEETRETPPPPAFRKSLSNKGKRAWVFYSSLVFQLSFATINLQNGVLPHSNSISHSKCCLNFSDCWCVFWNLFSKMVDSDNTLSTRWWRQIDSFIIPQRRVSIVSFSGMGARTVAYTGIFRLFGGEESHHASCLYQTRLCDRVMRPWMNCGSCFSSCPHLHDSLCTTCIIV